MTDTQQSAYEALQISLDSRDDGSQDVVEARRSAGGGAAEPAHSAAPDR